METGLHVAKKMMLKVLFLPQQTVLYTCMVVFRSLEGKQQE